MTAPAEANWEEWLRRHGPALLLAARQWVSRQADAEDVVQEAFLRFWRCRDRAADPAAYLYACAKRCALEWHRGGRRRERREGAAAGSIGPAGPMDPAADNAWFAPAASIERDERRERIEAVLARLPEAQREVLVMKIWGGLSFPQIAAALGVPPDTAASRYRYALARLRKDLAEETVP
jgi:RNA polymerase sigma-70 factor (ECF subfamily)